MNAITATARAVSVRKSEITAIVGAAILGLGIILTTGFAYPAALHDTAHDTRHAIGFPCH